MHIIGILNDKKMALEIEAILLEREILSHYFYSEEHKAYVIAVENENQMAIAIDIYRVKMGLKKPVEIDQEWVKIKSVANGAWTIRILIFCVLIYLISFLPFGAALYDVFKIDTHADGFLFDITRGQIWRIITPIFLHMGILHILFNMLWFKDLGNILEQTFKTQNYLIFILTAGIISNLIQYVVVNGNFGGMSGVLYGMMAYIWVKKEIDIGFEFSLPKHDQTIMMVWFFLCLFNIIPNVANLAHAGGAFVGILWAILENINLEKLKEKQRLKFLSIAVLLLVVSISIEKYKHGV